LINSTRMGVVTCDRSNAENIFGDFNMICLNDGIEEEAITLWIGIWSLVHTEGFAHSTLELV